MKDNLVLSPMLVTKYLCIMMVHSRMELNLIQVMIVDNLLPYRLEEDRLLSVGIRLELP